MRTLYRTAWMAVLSVGLMLGGTALAQTTPGNSGQAMPNQHGQMMQNQSNQATTRSGEQVLVDPAQIYNATRPIDWVGKSVALKNVTVQDTNDTGNFWVGSDSDHRLLVVKGTNNPTEAAIRLHKGDIVTVSGTVEAASDYMAAKTTASSDSMGDAHDSSGVFLLANNVQIVSSMK